MRDSIVDVMMIYEKVFVLLFVVCFEICSGLWDCEVVRMEETEELTEGQAVL